MPLAEDCSILDQSSACHTDSGNQTDALQLWLEKLNIGRSSTFFTIPVDLT
jgi:hypothetical protein